MRIRRSGAAAVAVSVLFLAATGCGNSAGGDAADPAGGPIEGPVDGTINVWTWDGAPGEDAMTALAEAFEASTGVQVESRIIDRDDYKAQVQLALNSGESIDVLGVQPSQFATEVQAQMRPVSDYENLLANGLEGYSALTREQTEKLYGGETIYSVPFGSTGSAVCFYNKDILDQAGVQPPQTWADVQALSQALQTSSPDTFTLVKPSGSDAWFEDEFVLTMAGQTDPGFFDGVRYDGGAWNSDAYVTALTRYGQLYEDGTLQRDALDLGYDDAKAAFTAGRAALACNGSWEAGVLRQDYREENGVTASAVGVIPVPSDDPATRSARSFLDVTWGIPQGATNPAAAAAFISFATQGEGVDLWAEDLSFVPAAADWQLDPATFAGDPVAAEGYATIQRLIGEPSSDRNNLSSLSDEVGKYVLEVAQGRMTPQVAADESQAALESGLYN